MGNSCMENTLSAFSKKNQPPYTIEQHTAVDDVSSLVYQLNITLHQAKVAGEGADEFVGAFLGRGRDAQGLLLACFE